MPDKKQDKIFIKAEEWLPVYLDLVNSGHKVNINPIGYSMYPFLASKRDQAVLVKLPDKLKRGDICVYRRTGGQHVIHRIHHIDKNGGIYMVGDSQREIEGPLDSSQMMAFVEGLIRKGKYCSCDNPVYKIKWKIWMLLRPIRPEIIGIFNSVRKLKRKFFNKTSNEISNKTDKEKE